MRIPASPKPLLVVVPVLAVPLLFTQCTSVGPVVAVEGEVGTPTHSLPKHEYPFDESGRYREDWVSSSGRGDSSSSRSRFRSSSSSSDSRTSAAAPASVPKLTPVPDSALIAAATTGLTRQEYHTVGRGETLWSISRRYGVSVASLKAENGLDADAIQIGETLRLP
jgi:hypothetical protein